jgi:hypothetical protein
MTEQEVVAPATPEAIPTEADMLRLAEAADRGEVSETPAAPLAAAGKADEATKQAAETPKAPAADNPKTDDHKPEAAPAKPDKAQREAERRERSWKALEEQKAAFRAEQERLAKERAELESQRQQTPSSETEQQAKSYDKLAKDYEAEGKDDYAEIARKEAAKLRQQDQQARQQADRAKLQEQWNKDFAELRDKDPEVADEASETYKSMEAIFRENQFLASVPNGLQKAYKLAKLQQDAAAASGLREKVTGYEQRISELEKKLALGGSYPTAPQGEKAFEQMSHDEQGKYLAALTRQLDGES